MYIPREQAFLQRPAPPIAFPSYDPLSRDTETAFYYYSSRVVGTNGTADPENDARAIIVSAAFISVTVTCLSIFALLFGVALYRRCTGRDDQSDTSSATSESAWHIDGTDVVADDDVAKRHRQRLKKLDQVAPRKSLHDWRAEKTTSHVQTFATASPKLI
ncbi:hypothetical protein A1O3_07402 [Capronia epimyces CBS 606.96]|uniref:Uncharacterized protein n=1 Tax=Capronia epimyces CBS 606.96 TaxID=1182542 RepID=W9YFN5_9EURO|nr:uncharacterized protein A1O3_07402 [Capronia epimyces CBS 606.96]EXJ81114.1 hypothetical protein A1O3_07402 [Capronia epimyces CBS 606.96]